MAGLPPELKLKLSEYCAVGELSRAMRIRAKSGCRSPSKSAMANCVEPRAAAVPTRREIGCSAFRNCRCPAHRDATKPRTAIPGRNNLLEMLRRLIATIQSIALCDVLGNPRGWRGVGYISI